MIPSTFFKTATGNYWLPDTPNCGTCRIIKSGKVYDQYVIDTLEPYIRPGSTVIDLGACFGQMSVMFSKLVGPDGLVIAVEANPDVYEIMEANVRENSPNIRPVHAAAWHVSGETLEFPKANMDDLLYPSYACWGLSMQSPLGHYDVPTMAIDDLDVWDVSAIKIDVQGADLHAMQGGQRIMKECHPAVLFEYESGMSGNLGHGWRCYGQFIESVDYETKARLAGSNFLILPK